MPTLSVLQALIASIKKPPSAGVEGNGFMCGSLFLVCLLLVLFASDVLVFSAHARDYALMDDAVKGAKIFFAGMSCVLKLISSGRCLEIVSGLCLAGGVAGCLSKTMVAPVERLKCLVNF